MKNLKASKTSSVPSHMYFERRGSSDGRNAASCRVRTVLLTPSAPTIRSASASCGSASALKRSSTPSAAARRWSVSSSARRLSAEKPWPPEVTTSPW